MREPAREVGLRVSVELPIRLDAVAALAGPFDGGQNTLTKVMAVDAKAVSRAGPAGAETQAVPEQAWARRPASRAGSGLMG